MSADLSVLKDLFVLAFSFFTQPFDVFGFQVSWFGIAVACFVIGIPFLILERVLDL